MAVLIRGMDLPKRCNECFAYDFEWEFCTLYSYGVPARCDIEDPSIRQEWCELEEVEE